MRNILSINFNHDGSGVILRDGAIAGFVNTERFSRKKKHPGIRAAELIELLEQSGLSVRDLDFILLCNLHNMDTPDIPAKHGTDLKETWLDFRLDESATTVSLDGVSIPCLVNPTHHMLHVAAAYYTSPFDSAIAFSADPVGCAAYICENNSLRSVPNLELDMSASLGYNAVSDELFGSPVFSAGKVMGLAPYGKPEGVPPVDYHWIQTLEQLAWLGGINPVMVEERERRLNATLAYHIQQALEVQLSDILRQLHSVGVQHEIAPNLCLGGGTALNSVANQIAFAQSGFERLHLHPACGDDGTAIGAALWYWHHQLGHPKRRFHNRELMYSVREYGHLIDHTLARYADRIRVEHTESYLDATAELLLQGKIIGWFQGPSEIGPRALGNRSILADPRSPNMKDLLNSRIKFRERFRPFAPSVLDEQACSWFGLSDSPFMLRVARVLKDGIPAVTHVDRTARIQSVAAQDNPAFYGLIDRFFLKTGVPLVLNTSFNIKDEPIVETPDDALRCFLSTGLDHLVFENRIVCKRGSP